MNNKNNILYVGLDVHKNSITIVVFKNNENEPFIVISKRNEKSELKKYFKKLQERGVLVCCYEAGPTGFELYRFLIEIGVQCIIVAPGLLPKKPGNRIKNDKRDATNLAKSLVKLSKMFSAKLALSLFVLAAVHLCSSGSLLAE